MRISVLVVVVQALIVPLWWMITCCGPLLGFNNVVVVCTASAVSAVALDADDNNNNNNNDALLSRHHNHYRMRLLSNRRRAVVTHLPHRRENAAEERSTACSVCMDNNRNHNRTIAAAVVVPSLIGRDNNNRRQERKRNNRIVMDLLRRVYRQDEDDEELDSLLVSSIVVPSLQQQVSSIWTETELHFTAIAAASQQQEQQMLKNAVYYNHERIFHEMAHINANLLQQLVHTMDSVVVTAGWIMTSIFAILRLYEKVHLRMSTTMIWIDSQISASSSGAIPTAGQDQGYYKSSLLSSSFQVDNSDSTLFHDVISLLRTNHDTTGLDQMLMNVTTTLVELQQLYMANQTTTMQLLSTTNAMDGTALLQQSAMDFVGTILHMVVSLNAALQQLLSTTTTTTTTTRGARSRTRNTLDQVLFVLDVIINAILQRYLDLFAALQRCISYGTCRTPSNSTSTTPMLSADNVQEHISTIVDLWLSPPSSTPSHKSWLCRIFPHRDSCATSTTIRWHELDQCNREAILCHNNLLANALPT